MKKLLIYTNKDITTIHIVEEEKVFETLMNLLKNDLNPYQIDIINSSLDLVMKDNDISFELISIFNGCLLPEGIKLTTQKTEYYND
tara:strand:+ start:8901 stop:9158 length:258 start_codon:yes stop_codon:yes gene_type:complete